MKIKKIVAGMVAGVMAASMMSIGASAKSFSLHQWQMAPSSDNVIYQELYFELKHNYYDIGNCSYFSLTNGNVLTNMYTFYSGTFNYKGQTQISGTGSCSIYNSSVRLGDICKTTVNFMNTNAYGQVNGTYE